MSTIAHPPTPVNDDPTADKAALPQSPPHIDIHERMLSPFADADHARWMIIELYRRGWTTQYQPNRPRWAFNSYEEAIRFRETFDALLLEAAEAFVWPVDIYDEDEQGVVRDYAAASASVDGDTRRSAASWDER